ncbi:pentapeptide repeat-containing protein [Rhodococcus sp. WMMA185]|uniref:pentapeptide repeat-containing protein n=1 Tax=Rhodococcus sp. WMMA185 TaxID=679318 RepID=UPI003FA77D25
MGAELTGSILTGSMLTGSELTGAELTGSELVGWEARPGIPEASAGSRNCGRQWRRCRLSLIEQPQSAEHQHHADEPGAAETDSDGSDCAQCDGQCHEEHDCLGTRIGTVTASHQGLRG